MDEEIVRFECLKGCFLIIDIASIIQKGISKSFEKAKFRLAILGEVFLSCTSEFWLVCLVGAFMRLQVGTVVLLVLVRTRKKRRSEIIHILIRKIEIQRLKRLI